MAANTLTYAFVASDGNAALATAKTAFNVALAAVMAATYQGGPVSILNTGLGCVENSQAAGVIIYQPWAFVSYYSAS